MAIAISGPITINVPKADGSASAIKATAIDTMTDKSAVVWWLCAYADTDNTAHTLWLPASCVAERSV